MTIALRPPLLAAPPGARPDLVPVQGAALARALWRAPQAEWGLALQGAEVALTRDQSAGWLVRRLGRLAVAIGRPMGRPGLGPLRDLAPGGLLLYKCDGRTAALARREGWVALRLGWEARLDLAGWSPDRPACRQLRRKLRAAAAAGIVAALEEEPPLTELADLAAAWSEAHGRERGFSMGRFEGALLRRQRVVVARRDGRALAFASLFAARDEWSLDLMRHGPGLPDGTMHALVAAALAEARRQGVARLSLAAIPDLASLPRPLRGGAEGLGQFKRSFGPALLPLYAAAPTRASLLGGLAAVAWAIHRPGPLAGDGHKGFEPVPALCDARPRPPGAVPVPFRDEADLRPAAFGEADWSPGP